MKQSVKRLLSSALALLLVVGSFVTFFNFIQPVYDQVSELKGEILGQKDLVKHEQDVINAVQKLVSVYNQSQGQRDSLSAALPDSPSLAEALTQLNGLAAQNHLTPQAYSLSAPTTIIPESARRDPAHPGSGSLVQPVSTVVFQIKLLGSYEDFKSFLAGLEENIRIMDVKSLNLQAATAPTGKSAQNLFAYDLTVAAYYQTSSTTP